MADDSVSWPSELELKLNLNAIKKSDQFVVNIIDTASQVALYKFKSETQAWEKTDVEGALFVYSRSSYPKHSFFIMNRLNMNNILETITSDMEFKQQDPFLLFRNKTSGIYGIWFYDQQECSRLSNLLIRLSSEELPQERPISNPELFHKENQQLHKQPKQQPNGKVDILGMLTSAQEEYNKRTLEQTTSQEQNLVVQHPKQQLAQQNQQQIDHLQQLMRGTTEQRPGKQRAYSSPAQYNPPASSPGFSGPFPNISENGLSEKQIPLGYQIDKESPKPQLLSPGTSRSGDSTPDRPGAQRKLFQGDKQQSESPQKGPDQAVTLAASLLSPMAFKTTVSASQPKPASEKMEISPLTQDQLLQAMMYLMKNDANFIKKLHEAYLKSLQQLLPT